MNYQIINYGEPSEPKPETELFVFLFEESFVNIIDI